MSEPGRFVIGLDLSLTAAGLSDYNLDSGLFSVETFGTKGKRTDTYAMRGERLRKMRNYVCDWAVAGPVNPELVVIEGPALGSLQGSVFDRSGLWWGVVNDLQDAGLPVLVVPPKTRAKYATGNGNSGKDVVLAHVIEQYADFMDECSIRNDNEADALVLSAMGARYLGEPQEDYLPETNLSSMSGVEIL